MHRRYITSAAAALISVCALASQSYDTTSFEAGSTGAIVVDNRFSDTVFGSSSPESDWSEIAEYGDADLPAENAGSRYLGVNSQEPLTRNVSGTATATAYDIGEGLYVDMYVRFSVGCSLPTVVSGDKISVWMAGDANGASRLVVTAGRLAGIYTAGVETAHYSVTVDGGTPDPDEWHRLVVKAYKTAGAGVNVPTFVVLIDGIPAKAEGYLSFDQSGNIVIDSSKPDGSSMFVSRDPSFASVVTSAALREKLLADQLFPSLGGTTLTTVGFVGVGDVDLYSVSDVDPVPDVIGTTDLDISASTGITVTPSHFTGLAPGETATFTVAAEPGCSVVETDIWGTSVNGPGEYTVTVPARIEAATYMFTILSSSVIATVDGAGYESMQDAFDEAAALGPEHPVVLVRSTSVSLADSEAAYINGRVDVAFDLNGMTLGGEEDDCWNTLIYIENSRLTIKDTAGSGGMVQPENEYSIPAVTVYDSTLVVEGGTYVGGFDISNISTLTVEGGTFNGEFKIDPKSTVTVAGGRFSKEFFGETEFSLTGYVKSGCVTEESGGYWVVSGGTDTSEFPAEWNGGNGEDGVSQAILDRFAAWSQSNDPGGVNAEAAFLLNVAPSAEVSLEATAITVDPSGKVTITTDRNLESVNGVVYVLLGTDPDTVTIQRAVDADDIDGSVLEVDGSGAPAVFFKVGVGYSEPTVSGL